MKVLEDAGFLRPTDDPRRWEFASQMTREAVYNMILRTERRRMHIMLARELETGEYADDLATIANHYFMGCSGEEAAHLPACIKAVEYFTRAGTAAQAAMPHEALPMLQTAEDLSEVTARLSGYDATWDAADTSVHGLPSRGAGGRGRAPGGSGRLDALGEAAPLDEDMSWVSVSRRAQLKLFMAECQMALRGQAGALGVGRPEAAELVQAAAMRCIQGLALLGVPDPQALAPTGVLRRLCRAIGGRCAAGPGAAGDDDDAEGGAERPLRRFESQVACSLLKLLAQMSDSLESSEAPRGGRPDPMRVGTLRYCKRVARLLARRVAPTHAGQLDSIRRQVADQLRVVDGENEAASERR